MSQDNRMIVDLQPLPGSAGDGNTNNNAVTEEARSESPRRNPDAPGDHVEIPRPAGVVAAGAEAARELEAVFTRQLQLSSQAVSEVIAQQLAFLKNNGFAAKSAQSLVVPAPGSVAGSRRAPLIPMQPPAAPAVSPPAGAVATFPLTEMQKQVWALAQMQTDGSLAYNDNLSVAFKGELDPRLLQQALQTIIDRYEILRTSITPDGQFHKVRPRIAMPLPLADFSARGPAEREERILKWFREENNRLFDLQQGPLCRAALLKITKTHHILMLTIHHIIFDGLSYGVLLNELSSIYSALRQNRSWNLPRPVEFRDYVRDLKQRVASEEMVRHKDYWFERFVEIVPDLNLPVYGPARPSQKSFQVYTRPIEINQADYKALQTLGRQHDCTLFMTLMAVYMVLLYRITNQNHILVGTPVSGRSLADDERLVGFSTHLLPIFSPIDGKRKFTDFLSGLGDVLLEAYEHRDYPYAAQSNQLSRGRDLSRAPSIRALFNLDEFSLPAFHDLEAELFFPPRNFAPFDMTLLGTAVDRAFILNLYLNSALFDDFASTRIARYFQNLLQGILAHPEQAILDLPLLDEPESRLLLQAWNNTDNPQCASDLCVHAWFENQVRRMPESTAASFNGQSLSYAELNARANQLAHLLRNKGVQAEDVVGIMFERSLDMLAGVLGILKAGAAYLPLDPSYPEERVLSVLNDSGTSLLLSQEKAVNRFSFTALSNIKYDQAQPIRTPARPFIADFDRLPFPDRTLVAYEKYHRSIGLAPAKHTVSLQISRGCPFHCLYCHKIWPKKQVMRSVENIFEEIRQCYAAGASRFVMVDDIFNLDKKTSSGLLRRIIKDKLDLQLFFPNGLRGDILTPDFVDLLIEAGTVDITVALESASPRIQKLIHKNLDLEKFQANLEYITQTYPRVITEMHMMIGFPTETEEEAMQTYHFLQSMHWIHFPNLFILKIFPHTDMARFAVAQGISEKRIESSAKRAYHELPETLPFPKHFVRHYQSRFMSEYFLFKERLLQVLPAQMKILTPDEIIQKYDSYLPQDIRTFSELLDVLGVSAAELGNPAPLSDDYRAASDFREKMMKYFPVSKKPDDALRILLLDLSTLFKADAEENLYDVIEAPLGLMYLMTYLNQKFGPAISGKVAKSRIDFDNFKELKQMVAAFRPQIIGIRSLSIAKEFFHKTVALLKQWFEEIPIIAGGPYATSEYDAILSDRNIDVVVLGEGEITLFELIQKVMEQGGKLPKADILEQVPGLAFVPRPARFRREPAEKQRDIILWDHIRDETARYKTANPISVSQPLDLAYVLYTSGSTGKPKGVAMEHRPLANLIAWQIRDANFKPQVKTLQFASLNFDVSFQEIFSTFAAGGNLILISEEDRRDPVILLESINREKIERSFLPFVALQQMAETAEADPDLLPIGLRDIITAGERLQITPEIRALFKKLKFCRLHNHYGPTESHVVTSFALDHPVEQWPLFPSIGRPIANAKIYILDPVMKPVPIGVPGEICIGGAGVARSYLNQPEMTRESFIPNPFAPAGGSRLYKTGDFGRYYADGNIEYIGRLDHQVKIRGYRIELGEIEITLKEHSHVKEAVVIGVADATGKNRLKAYVVPQTAEQPLADELREWVKGRMPEYMIPSDFIIQESLPRTSSGKVDLHALAVMKEDHHDENYVAPRTEAEKKLHDIWIQILDIKRIGIHDNFFELGGHSLLATQVINRIHKSMSLKLSMQSLSDRPTIAGLAEWIEALRGAAGEALPVSQAFPDEREEMIFF